MKPVPDESPAARLRAEFDRAFGEPPSAQSEDPERLLAIGAGDGDYALRLTELAGLSAGKGLLPGPGRAPGYLGLGSLRGSLLPVWDLAQLLGHPPLGLRPPWLALAAGESAWALAFERFEGSFSLSPDGLLPHAGGGPAAAFTPHACSVGGRLRKVISLAPILETIRGRIRA